MGGCPLRSSVVCSAAESRCRRERLSTRRFGAATARLDHGAAAWARRRLPRVGPCGRHQGAVGHRRVDGVWSANRIPLAFTAGATCHFRPLNSSPASRRHRSSPASARSVSRPARVTTARRELQRGADRESGTHRRRQPSGAWRQTRPFVWRAIVRLRHHRRIAAALHSVQLRGVRTQRHYPGLLAQRLGFQLQA